MMSVDAFLKMDEIFVLFRINTRGFTSVRSVIAVGAAGYGTGL